MNGKKINHMTLLVGLLILALCQYQCSCCNGTQEDNQTCTVCGNGIIQEVEECDDGNQINGDGCSNQCIVQAGFYCKVFNNTQSICCNTLIYFKDNKRRCQILCNDGLFQISQINVCYIQCPTGQFYNATSAKCINKTIYNVNSTIWGIGCDTGRQWDPTSRSCLKTCPTGYLLNATEDCVLKPCPNGMERNITGLCVACPIGMKLNTTGNCQQICQPGYDYNATTQNCSARCTNGSFFNLLSKVCQSCQNDTILNKTSKKCEKCPNGTFLNATINICQKKCSIYAVYNLTTGDCEYVCPEGYKLDMIGLCVPLCRQGSVYNRTSTKCQTIKRSYSIQSFSKIPDQNAFVVTVSYVESSVPSRLLLGSQLSIKVNFPYQNYKINSTSNNQISIIFTYNESLNSLSNMTVSINNATIQLPPVTDNNLALKFYSSSQYEAYQTFNSLMPIFTYGVIFLLAVTFLFSSKLIAIQTLLVFQFTYGGLIMMRKIEAMMYPYKQLWLFDGFNLYINDGTDVPPRLSALDLHANFFSNFNFDLIIFLLPSLLGYAFIIAHKILKKMKRANPLNKYSQYCLGDWQLSALLICIQQLVFAFVINIQYSPQPIAGIVVGVLLLLLYGFTAVRFYDKKKSATDAMKSSFGDYKKFFQLQHLNFYIWAMIYRATLSLILVLMSDSIISQSFVLFWTVSWAGYLVLKRPYKKSASLIPIINSLMMVLLSIFFLYQRNKADDASINFATYMPIVVIVLLGLTCIFNSIYAGVNFHHVRKHKKKMEAIKREVEKNNSENVELQFHSHTLQQITSQPISQNLSNLIAEIRQQNEKKNHEKHTTALKDISPIRPINQSEIIAQSVDISEIPEGTKNKTERISQIDLSKRDSNST